MKKVLLSIVYFLAGIFSVEAQILYGITFSGGSEGAGAITKFLPATNSLTAVKSFETMGASSPGADLVEASNGKLYGMANIGGIATGFPGIIFSFDPSTSAFTKVVDFYDPNTREGSGITGSLLRANDGKLYGFTVGGNSGGGVLFSFDPVSATYANLRKLDVIDGFFPTGSLLLASDGKLYGVTSQGGANNNGVIFSYDPSTSVYNKILDFDNTDARSPSGSLIQANDGKLYGVTSTGGISNRGVIFSFDLSSAIYTKVKDFVSSEGFYPFGGLIHSADGKLYGMTSQGGTSQVGVIFSFDPSSSAYIKRKDFDGTNGASPSGSLIQASDGKLYGMTKSGGSSDAGVIFSFDPSVSTYTKLEDFDNTNGAMPNASLLQASNGKLYGMTPSGGVTNTGVIFSLDPLTPVYSKLKDFGINETGRNPSGSMVQASDGKLYGMTVKGGGRDSGVIYSFDPSTSIFTKLKDFDKANGANPYGSLIQASNGKLYGITSAGGSNGYGVMFSFDLSGSVYTKLKDFDATEGSGNGSLLQASDGKLYGMTVGNIFSFDPSTSTYTNLRNFDFINGIGPYGSLIQASDGKLYGLTRSGGTGFIDRLSAGLGVIFSFDPSSSTYTKLKDFTILDGYYPYGSLVQASNGKLYGMTSDGEQITVGVIFSFDLVGSVYTKLKVLNDPYGRGYGNFMQASDGKLYGSSFASAESREGGAIFSVDPGSSTYKKLKDYDGVNGVNPYIGSGFVELRECPAKKTYYQDADSDGYGNPNIAISACIKPAGYVADNTDCDDNNSAIHASVTWYRDEDGDGYGNPSISIKACTKPAGYVANNNDCNDKNRASHAPVTYYRDADRDGYGDPSSPLSVCKSTPPAGYVRNAYDCNDHKRAAQFWNERVLMCHNGISGCVYAKEIFLRLCQGWTLGLCPPNCNNNISRTIPGQIDIADIYGKKEPVPQQYKLSNFPNPFARTSTIKYELPLDSKVSIKVYDVLGRTVATLVNEYKKAGVYTVDFNGGNVSSGSLYYRIIATSKGRQFDQTNKMIQLR
ncbi:MAG: choice-of-anchor tandem repeat GloVer-containing protein [Ferruginibacter sp.]